MEGPRWRDLPEGTCEEGSMWRDWMRAQCGGTSVEGPRWDRRDLDGWIGRTCVEGMDEGSMWRDFCGGAQATELG